MTYWPISSPSVFAAAKHTLPEHTQTSHDGAEPASGGRKDGAAADDSTASSIADSEEQSEGDDPSTQGKHGVDEKAPAQRATPPRGIEQLSEDDVSGEIIGIKVTRSGHMFATITWSTLTIWQTKARHCSSSPAQSANLLAAHSDPGLGASLSAFYKDIWT